MLAWFGIVLFLATVVVVVVLGEPVPFMASHPRQRLLQQQQQQPPSSPYMARLRENLLANYDRGSFPFESVWGGEDVLSKNRTGLEIEVSINFHRVFKVDVTSSVADLVVWFRQQWKDPRLAWDPADYGGLTTVWFWIGDGTGPGGETSEIWTPDLELWNLESSLSSSLVDMNAVVSSDGVVFWSRPGHFRPVCKFTGLNAFPFDTLDCTAEIGSWSYSGLYIRPIKMRSNGGYSIGGSDTAGEAYAEFSLLNVECEEHLYPPYPALPEEDWPVLFYHITFARAWQPYVRGYIVLQILLNLASFACFWLPPNGGERMSLNISSVLASVASEFVVAANLPAASELTWFSRFSLASLVFTVMALFESAAVIYFYYHTGSSLTPRWYTFLCSPPEEEAAVPPAPHENDRMCEHPRISEEERTEKEEETTTTRHNQDYSIDDGEEERPFTVRFRTEDSTTPSAVSSPSIEQLHRKSIRTVMGRDADDFKNLTELENNIRWQKTAKLLDEISRVVFPVVFAIFLGTTFTGLNV